MNRLKIAQMIALGATAASVIGLISLFNEWTAGMLLLPVGVFGALVAYVFGGLFTAIKMAGSIAKWGLIAFPFPGNLFAFVLSFMFALLVFVFLPILPVNKARQEYGM